MNDRAKKLFEKIKEDLERFYQSGHPDRRFSREDLAKLDDLIETHKMLRDVLKEDENGQGK